MVHEATTRVLPSLPSGRLNRDFLLSMTLLEAKAVLQWYLVGKVADTMTHSLTNRRRI